LPKGEREKIRKVSPLGRGPLPTGQLFVTEKGNVGDHVDGDRRKDEAEERVEQRKVGPFKSLFPYEALRSNKKRGGGEPSEGGLWNGSVPVSLNPIFRKKRKKVREPTVKGTGNAEISRSEKGKKSKDAKAYAE